MFKWELEDYQRLENVGFDPQETPFSVYAYVRHLFCPPFDLLGHCGVLCVGVAQPVRRQARQQEQTSIFL